jgi:hypothetical protein
MVHANRNANQINFAERYGMIDRIDDCFVRAGQEPLRRLHLHLRYFGPVKKWPPWPIKQDIPSRIRRAMCDVARRVLLEGRRALIEARPAREAALAA